MQQNTLNATTATDSPVKLKRSTTLFKRPRPFETFVQGLLFFCGAVSILTTVGIVLTLGSEALYFFNNVGIIDVSRRLAEPLSVDATQLVMGTAGSEILAGHIIKIDDEMLLVTAAADKEHLTVERGHRNTAPQEHTDGSAVFRAKDVTLTEFFSNTKWQPQIGELGVLPLLNATLYISFIAMLVAIPIGMGAAIYLSEYAAPGVRQTLKPILEILAGVPTVVFGYFALTFMTPLLQSWFSPATSGIENLILVGICLVGVFGIGAVRRRADKNQDRYLQLAWMLLILLAVFFALRFTPFIFRTFLDIKEVGVYNMASAGIVIGILIVPTISTISEDAMRAVPRSLREASYGLGATRFETIIKVIIPAALSGILAAVLLGISRAVGETMVVALAAGAGPNLTWNPFDAAETITGHIARISTGDLSYHSMDYNSLFALGLTLFIITLLMNLASAYITRRFREVYQ